MCAACWGRSPKRAATGELNTVSRDLELLCVAACRQLAIIFHKASGSAIVGPLAVPHLLHEKTQRAVALLANLRLWRKKGGDGCPIDRVMSSDAWQVGLRGQSSVRAFVRSRVRSFTVDKDALEEKAQAVVLPSKGRQFRLMRQATRLSEGPVATIASTP